MYPVSKFRYSPSSPTRASLDSQNSRQTAHLLGGTTQTLQGGGAPPPRQAGCSHLLPSQSPGSPRSPASHSNWEATGFGSKGHFEVKQKVAWGSKPDPEPALDCPQALCVFRLSLQLSSTGSAWEDTKDSVIEKSGTHSHSHRLRCFFKKYLLSFLICSLSPSKGN